VQQHYRQIQSTTYIADRHGGVGGRWRRGLQRTPRRRPGVRRYRYDTEFKLMLFSCCERHGDTLSPTGHIYTRSFRQQMTVVEIIIADLHCLSNGGCRVGLLCETCNCCGGCGLCRPAMHV